MLNNSQVFLLIDRLEKQYCNIANTQTRRKNIFTEVSLVGVLKNSPFLSGIVIETRNNIMNNKKGVVTFLQALKRSAFRISWKRNDIADITHSRNELNYSFKS